MKDATVSDDWKALGATACDLLNEAKLPKDLRNLEAVLRDLGLWDETQENLALRRINGMLDDLVKMESLAIAVREAETAMRETVRSLEHISYRIPPSLAAWLEKYGAEGK